MFVRLLRRINSVCRGSVLQCLSEPRICSSIPWFAHLIDIPDSSNIFVYFVNYGRIGSRQREQWAAPAGRATGCHRPEEPLRRLDVKQFRQLRYQPPAILTDALRHRTAYRQPARLSVESQIPPKHLLNVRRRVLLYPRALADALY